jgi:hypothetical protein
MKKEENKAFWNDFKTYEEILFKDKSGVIDQKLEQRFKEQPHL